MTSSSIFFDGVLLFLSSWGTSQRFMSISSVVLELWQFSFIRDWLEIQKLEIPPSPFYPISGDWGKLGIPNLARMSLIDCYYMLQNSRVLIFTIFELLRENQLGDKITPTPNPLPPPHIRIKRALRAFLIFFFLYGHALPQL